MATITPIATLQASINNNSTITVPANVTLSHMGIAVFVSANLWSTGSIPAISGWTNQASNPSVANNMEWTVLSRNGGVKAGDVLTITQNKTTQFDLYMIWYDTQGLDIVIVGTPGGRSGTSSQFNVINGITATAGGQGVIAVSSERSSPTGTLVSSWSGNYTPANDNFVESTTAVGSSNMFAHFSTTTAGATGNVTANYNMASGNAVGILFGLGVPGISAFHDPFTTANWDTTGADPAADWFSGYNSSVILMQGGTLKIPYMSDFLTYMYPETSFIFNQSQIWAEFTMQDNQVGTFSFRLTTDGIPEKGNSFTSIGIAAGGALYTNERTFDPVNGSIDRVRNFSSVNVAVNTPIGLRIRHGGGALVYFDYSYDNVNWTNLDSRNITCFNPATANVQFMFQTGTTDGTDKQTTYCLIQNLNQNAWTPPPAQPWVATTLWSYWNGTKELALNPADSWDYVLLTAQGLFTCSTTLMCSTNIFPEPDTDQYPGGSTYPDGGFPSTTHYPGTADYPSALSTIYPGGN